MKFILNILPAALICLSACNPSSEDIEERIWSSLHPVRPAVSTIYHGLEYEDPVGACDEPQCHGKELKGGNSGAPSCYRCHGELWIFSSTHTLNIGGYRHHTAVDDYPADRNSSIAWFPSCRNIYCHGASLEGVQGNGPGCTKCHTPVPPPGHRVVIGGTAKHHYNYTGDPLVYCSGNACHGADIKGGATGAPSCYKCHGEVWNFAVTHTLVAGGYRHHTAVDDYPADRNSNSAWFPTCRNVYCHGASLGGVAGSGPECTQCHTPVPPPGHRVILDGFASHHYNYRKDTAIYCSGNACHGPDGKHGVKACSSSGCHD